MFQKPALRALTGSGALALTLALALPSGAPAHDGYTHAVPHGDDTARVLRGLDVVEKSARHPLGKVKRNDGFRFLPEAGGNARALKDGGFLLRDKATGELSITHGPDAVAANGTVGNFGNGGVAPLPSSERMVECIAHNGGAPQIVFLYGHYQPRAWRYLDVRPGLESIIRRMNDKIAKASIASGGSDSNRASIRMPCYDPPNWKPWVGGFTNYPGNRQGAPENSFADIREAAFDHYNFPPGTRVMVFYDMDNTEVPGANYSGQATGNFRDDRRDPALHAGGVHFGYTFRNYWNTNVTLHELFHTLDAVQYTAPHSNWIGHCNDGADVMCYRERDQYGNYYPGQYQGEYDNYRCTYQEEFGFAPLDCKYDTYFDRATSTYSPYNGYLHRYYNVATSRFLNP